MEIKPQISFICPAIRPNMYQGMYNSLLTTWHGSAELIFISPYDLPELNINSRIPVRLIKDFGCPSRALQLGWISAKSDWVSFMTDDCTFDPDTMNQAWRTLQKKNFDYKTVIVCKYTESDNWSKWMMTPFYYKAWFHGDFRHTNIPFHFSLYMNGLVSKKLMIETGGFDCKYETMAYCYNDWSMRAQFGGAKFIIEKNRLDHCQWMPKEGSDHGSVHHAVMEHDAPLFRGVYWAKRFKPVINISVDNWKQSPEKWPRRFK